MKRICEFKLTINSCHFRSTWRCPKLITSLFLIKLKLYFKYIFFNETKGKLIFFILFFVFVLKKTNNLVFFFKLGLIFYKIKKKSWDPFEINIILNIYLLKRVGRKEGGLLEGKKKGGRQRWHHRRTRHDEMVTRRLEHFFYNFTFLKFEYIKERK